MEAAPCPSRPGQRSGESPGLMDEGRNDSFQLEETLCSEHAQPENFHAFVGNGSFPSSLVKI